MLIVRAPLYPFFIFHQGCNSLSDLGVDYFFATLRADSCGNIFEEDQLAFDPEPLIDPSLFHPLPAPMALAIIV